jgi:ribosomal protein S18 acetylase RimI-like enzyme
MGSRIVPDASTAGTLHEQQRPVVIRPLDASDLPALKRVVDSTGLFPADVLDEMTAPFLEGLAAEEFWFTLAAPDPVAIAYCAPERMTSGAWNLLLIAVDRSRQGEGLGSTLMAEVERRLAEQKQRLLLVETSGLPDFERTRAFYAHRGYVPEARIRDYYRDGEDKIVFRKVLSALKV